MRASSRRATTLAALFAILLLAPAALAGTERNPEITDPQDQQNAAVDIRSAWVQGEADGLRFTIKVARFDAAPRATLYGIGFTVEGGARHVAVIGFDEQARTHTIVARVGYGDEYPPWPATPTPSSASSSRPERPRP